MNQGMESPIDDSHIQKNSNEDESMSVKFNALIQTYEAIRQGFITDTEKIRAIARQFEAIGDTPEASERFPKADQMAVTLYSQALEIDMRAKTGTNDQVMPHVNLIEHVSPKYTDEIIIDFVKISEEILFQLDHGDKKQFLNQEQSRESDRHTLERILDNHEKPTIVGHNSAKRSESNSVIREDINAGQERLIDLKSISDQWAALLKFIEIAEQEEKELTEKGVVKGPIDHNDLWKEWKE